MSRVISLSQTAVNSQPAAATVLFNSNKLSNISASGSGAVFQYTSLNGTKQDFYTVSNTVTQVNTAVNTANTTNTPNRDITLTIKNADGTTTARSINTNQIFSIQAHPADANDSLVILDRGYEYVLESLRVDETVAALTTAANG